MKEGKKLKFQCVEAGEAGTIPNEVIGRDSTEK